MLKLLDTVKKHIEIVPFYTVALIFLGYWNLFTYYKHFKIDIYYYVTTGELLLGFLSISIYVFYVISAIILFNVIVYMQIISHYIFKEKYKDDKERLEQNEQHRKHRIEYDRNYYNLIYKFKEFYKKSNYENRSLISNFFLLLLRIADFLIVFGLVVVLPIYSLFPFYYLLKDQASIFKDYQLITFYLGFLILYIFIVSESYFEKIPIETLKKTVTNYFRLTLIVYGLVFYILFNNYRKAYKIITHNPISEVKFQIDSTKYVTSDSLFFIGQTQNYLFLKDLKKDEVMIFNKSNIKNLNIKNLD